MRGRRLRAGAVALAAALLAACASPPISVERFEVADQPAVTRIALVPFSVRIPLDATRPAEEAAPYVTSRVLEALSTRGLEVVPPGEVNLALGTAGDPTDPAGIGGAVRAAFGVDAFVLGEVHRFRQREGGAKGARRPASVWLDLELRSTSGDLLWRGSYDETQRSFSDDPLGFSVARSRGFSWVTAEELARYGSEELVSELSEDLEHWR